MVTNLGWITDWRGLPSLCLAVALVVAFGCSKGDSRSSSDATGRSLAEQKESVEPVVRRMVVPEGTKIGVRLTSTVSSQTSRPGDRVAGVVTEPVIIGTTSVITAGSIVRGEVTVAHPLPKIGGRASLAFSLDQLETPDGRVYPIAAMFARTGPSETAKDTATIVAGVVIGAVAGHQVDDDPGRAIGGLAGGGIGTAIAASTEGTTIVLPPGTQLRLTMRMPVPVDVRV
ncbi:MAG: hypothetical protein HYU52_03130 [Acidobacteria bacterium]|nr:hypothetical protein [Acidobacteriota bacterium]